MTSKLKTMTIAEKKQWLIKEYKNIDVEFEKFKNKHTYDKVIFVYGGKTEEKLEIRHGKHKTTNPDLKGSKISLIKRYPEFEEYKKDVGQTLISELEKYLITLLSKTYKDKVYNKDNGGTGGQNDIGDLQRLYIIYKSKK